MMDKMKKLDWVVLLICGLLTGLLMVATWNINFFPSDEKHYLYSAALKLPHLSFVSQIHQGVDSADDVFLHGKEVLVFLFSLMQRFFRDQETVRPLMLITLMSFGGACLLFYHTAKYYWGRGIAFIAFIVFITCLWPYVYVLFPRHQIPGLFFFLWAVWLLQKSCGKNQKYLFLFLSGFLLCCAVYSSTVSAAYFPCFLASFCALHIAHGALPRHKRIKFITLSLLALLAGFLVLFLVVNFPNILYNVKNYFRHLQISSSINHFYYNQPMLQQWFSGSMVGIRGGWPWVGQYLLLVLPLLFPFYIFLVLYVIYENIRKKSFGLGWQSAGLWLVSVSALLLAELKGVAQYGANYFPVLTGFFVLFCHGLLLLKKRLETDLLFSPLRQGLIAAGVILLGVHICVNSYFFFSDIFPSRMATTFISQKIRSLGIKEIYVHEHPLKTVFTDNFNPDVKKKISLIPINNIYWPQKGYIFLPPVAGRTLFNCCFSYADFDDDIYLNELIKKGSLGRYAVASYKTVASSKIWSQEEEILSYMHLILKQFSQEDLDKGKAWILDAEKLRADLANNLPRKEYTDILLQGVENIGTRENIYRYEGGFQRFLEPVMLETMKASVYKAGNPQDNLVFYVFKRDPQNHFFFPYGPDYASLPLPASAIPSSQDKGAAVFIFKRPLFLEPGDYYFSIFRTGPPSDQDYYQVISDPQRQKMSSLFIPGLPLPQNP